MRADHRAATALPVPSLQPDHVRPARAAIAADLRALAESAAASPRGWRRVFDIRDYAIAERSGKQIG